MKPRHTAFILLPLGVVLGIAVWLLSPRFFGAVEPWDAKAPFWALSWLVVAVAGALTGHVRGVLLPLGYALGQVLVTIQSVLVGEFGALGWLFIAGYALVAALLTLALVGVTTLVKRSWRMRNGAADRA